MCEAPWNAKIIISYAAKINTVDFYLIYLITKFHAECISVAQNAGIFPGEQFYKHGTV